MHKLGVMIEPHAVCCVFSLSFCSFEKQSNTHEVPNPLQKKKRLSLREQILDWEKHCVLILQSRGSLICFRREVATEGLRE